ncbi:MAG: hypothetical protein IKO93_22795, partial [Lentisphaeria bacterium]|nr:hypothetical protein [Lentisphaeria bacterium]
LPVRISSTRNKTAAFFQGTVAAEHRILLFLAKKSVSLALKPLYFSQNGDKLSCSDENAKLFLKFRIINMSVQAEWENPELTGQNQLPPFIDPQKPFREDAR